ncbi:PAS domain S-box protein, partial [bacterium]|nr:PAS domain S-box protein [bacterium]
VSQVSRVLAATVSIDLDRVLGTLAGAVSASRAMMFLVQAESNHMAIVHEWRARANGGEARIKDMEASLLPWSMNRLKTGETVLSADVRSLPAGSETDRSTFDTLGISSVLMIPMITDDRLVGFVAFENMLTPQQISDEDTAILKTAAEMLAANMLRIDALQDMQLERDRAQNYLDIAEAVFIALDRDGRVSMINTRGCEVLEASEEEIVGSDWFETFLPPTVTTGVRAVFEDLMNGGTGHTERYENSITTLKGNTRRIAWHNSIIRNTDGTIAGALSSGMDVTDVRRAETTQQVAYAIAAAAHTTKDLDELYRTIHEELGGVLNTDNFFIALYDRVSDTISLPYFVDEQDQGRYDSFPAGRSLTAYVIRNNCPLLVDRATGDAMIERGEVDLVGSESKIWVGVPLMTQGLVIGAIVLQSYRNENEFDEDDLEMLKFVSGQIGVSIDRRKAEDQLRFLGSIPPQISEGIIVTDLDFNVTYANEAIVTMYGYERGEIIGSRPDILNADPLASEVQKQVDVAVSAGKTWQGEQLSRRKDGTTFSCELTISPLTGPDGQPTSYISIRRDITDRKHVEEMLQALNATSLALAHTASPNEVLSTTADTLAAVGLRTMFFLLDEPRVELRIVETGIDRALILGAERLLGMPVDHIRVSYSNVGAFRYAIDDRHSIFVENPSDLMDALVPPGSHITGADLASTLDLTQTIIAPLMDEGEVFGICEIHSSDLKRSDVPTATALANQIAAAWRRATVLTELQQSLDELKVAQDQLLQAQKMEAIGRLAGGVAHDFNNLLTAITGYTDLTLLGLEEDHKLRPHVTEVKRAAERAAGLTRQLLAFSRRQALIPQVLSLDEVATNMESMIKRLIGEDVELVTRISSELPGVTADAGQLEQVIVNMAINARDAMPGGGRLTISAAAVSFTEEETAGLPDASPGNYVRISIDDTGDGIPPEIRSRIFEPFFTTKPRGQGTGLGLAGAYGIIRQHEGWISLESEMGKGTTFHIQLPACSVAETAVAATEQNETIRTGDGEQ